MKMIWHTFDSKLPEPGSVFVAIHNDYCGAELMRMDGEEDAYIADDRACVYNIEELKEKFVFWCNASCVVTLWCEEEHDRDDYWSAV